MVVSEQVFFAARHVAHTFSNDIQKNPEGLFPKKFNLNSNAL